MQKENCYVMELNYRDVSEPIKALKESLEEHINPLMIQKGE